MSHVQLALTSSNNAAAESVTKRALRPTMTDNAPRAADERLALRHLSGPRRRVLEALSVCGPRTPGGIAECWIDRALDGTNRYADRLPGMVSQLLWKLEILDWVTEDEGRFAITADGSRALAAGTVV